LRKQWSDKGIFASVMAGLVGERVEEETVMIDATCLKVHSLQFRR
jgi:hypothetical protein